VPQVTEIVIPLDSAPVEKHPRLKLLFNNSAYRLIKEETGVSVFELAQNQKLVQDPEILSGVLFAATRKYHTIPLVSREQLDEWMDDVDSSRVFLVYGEIIKALTLSFLDPSKRQEYLAKFQEAEKAATSPHPETTETPNGNDTSSTP
jgi:hypothetical protein